MEDDTSRSQHAAAAEMSALRDPGGALARSGEGAPWSWPRAAVGNKHVAGMTAAAEDGVAGIVAAAVVVATAATTAKGGLAAEDLECPVCLSALQVGWPTVTSST